MELKTRYTYTTKSGNEYPIDVAIKVVPAEEIVHDYIKIIDLCRSGCKNFNKAGGCPPRAPRFESLKGQYKFAVLIYGRLDSLHKSEKVKVSNSVYIHYRSQDIILSNFLTKLGYNVLGKIKYNLVFLNNGFCMGCGNKVCSFKLGEDICQNPNRRTFSLEATGIDVESTLKNVFNINLQWYNKNNYNEVEVMTKAIGFFSSSKLIAIEAFNYIEECLSFS